MLAQGIGLAVDGPNRLIIGPHEALGSTLDAHGQAAEIAVPGPRGFRSLLASHLCWCHRVLTDGWSTIWPHMAPSGHISAITTHTRYHALARLV
jgi:hypothetical protein